MTNKKKLESVLILALSVFLCVLVVNTSKNYVYMWDSYIDEDGLSTILAGKEICTMPLSTDIVFDGQHLIYDDRENCFYYSLVQSDDNLEGYKLLFSPWDLDQTWGNGYAPDSGYHGITSYLHDPDYDLPIGWNQAVILAENGDDSVQKQMTARYWQLRASVWSEENINDLLDKYEAEIFDSGAFQRTQECWPDGNYEDRQIELSQFRYFVLKRLEHMDRLMTTSGVGYQLNN